MINSIAFVGERILNRPVQDMCSFDTDKCYVLSFCGCRWDMVDSQITQNNNNIASLQSENEILEAKKQEMLAL